jgi:cell volume regulation protein A
MFNIVFLCTLVSLVVQGTTLPLMARLLGVSDPPAEPQQAASQDFDIDFPEEIKSSTSDIEITEAMLEHGAHLMDLRLPEKTLAIMVKRGESYFVPTGKTLLHPGDRLMVLSDNQQALDDTLQRLGVSAPDDAPKPPKRPWYSVLFDDSE